MKQFTTLLISASFCINAHADIGLKFTNSGEFITPGKILQDRGVEHFKDGYKNRAIKEFKRSAKFGNDMSKYLVAMLYFEDKDWTTAHAWLKLIKNPVEQSSAVLAKLDKALTSNEHKLADQKLKNLKLEYGDLAVYQRRHKWQKSIKFTGSHISGFKSIDQKNLSVNPGNHVGHLANAGKATNNASGSVFADINGTNNSGSFANTMGLRKNVYEYVYEYLPQGEVNLGEIKEKTEEE